MSMNLQTKKILYIDLSRGTSDVKFHEDYGKYIGGVGLGMKILASLEDKDPIIIATGPLNGFFPFVSKTAIVTRAGVEPRQYFFGGSLSIRVRFTGLDAIVLLGESPEGKVLDIMDENVTFQDADTKTGTLGLPGKRSTISISDSKVKVDDYFETETSGLAAIFNKKGIKNIVITGTKTIDLKNKEKYKELYSQLLSRQDELETEKNGNPSCAGCPAGCAKSKIGESEGDLLVHSLVACKYAEPIYKDINTVFSCFNVLGYSYTHEDLENFPGLVYDLLEELRNK
jgi:aldehyde:ferredoxin oxidoreductase